MAGPEVRASGWAGEVVGIVDLFLDYRVDGVRMSRWTRKKTGLREDFRSVRLARGPTVAILRQEGGERDRDSGMSGEGAAWTASGVFCRRMRRIERWCP